MRRWRRSGLAVLLILLALGGGPAGADDDDDGGGGGGSSASGSAGGESGGGGGDGTSTGDQRRASGLGAPSTGSFTRDLRGVMGLFGQGAPAASPPAAPPSPTAPPQRQPAAAQRATSVPNQITGIGVDAAAAQRLLAAGFRVIEETPAGFLPGSLVRLALPPGLSAPAARDQARALAPAARFDVTHLYRPEAGSAPAVLAPAAPACTAGRPVGVVDTGFDPAHPALAERQVELVTRRGPGREPARTAHGTAVTVLLANALRDTPIVVVDAFHRRPDGDAADAFDVAAALGLLASRGIAVVNLSFAGPPNEVLALATERAAAQGMLLAAAAGNDGPRSPPRYPAAYPWVVAVTAVDAQRRPFVRAVRGSHLDFAAPGVGITALGRGTLSGTSYAVPFVTAAFALAMTARDRDAALMHLAGSAVDLGAPGRDPVFGWGLVRAPDCAAPDGAATEAAAHTSEPFR